jgi:hypothetical protein
VCPSAPQLDNLLKRVFSLIAAVILTGLCAAMTSGQAPPPNFRVIAIAEKGGVHQPFVDAAKVWLAREAVEDGFSIDYIENTDRIDDSLSALCLETGRDAGV